MNTKRLILTALVTASAAFAEQPVPVAEHEILVLAHFNTSAVPEKGNQDGLVVNAPITSGGSGMAFPQSIPRAEALDLSAYKSFWALPGTGNFDPEKGTIQFWFKTRWGQKGYIHSRIFQISDAKGTRAGVNWNGKNTLFLVKPPNVESLKLTHHNRAITTPLPYNPDLWHQFAATWSAEEGKLKFFLDGALVGSTQYSRLDRIPPELHWGAPDTHCGRVWIDELRILRRSLTDAEIRQDYLAQKDGGAEFSATSASESKPETFAPIPLRSAVQDSDDKDAIELPVTLVDGTIAIDGKIDETEWRNATPLPALQLRDGKDARLGATYRLLYDRDNLYVSAVAKEPEMQTCAAWSDQRDVGIFSDDCIEFLIKVPGVKENVFHFAATSLGTIYDSMNGQKNWNGKQIAAKAVRDNDCWTVEMKIPFADLGISPPRPGEYYPARFCRERHNVKGHENSSIPAVPGGGFDAPIHLGKMTFLGKAGNHANLSMKVSADSFLPGMNPFTVTVSNKSTAAIPAKLEASLYDRGGKFLSRVVRDFPIPAGESSSDIPVVVDNDETERIAISLTDARGDILCGSLIHRGYRPLVPSIRTIEAGIEQCARDVSVFGGIRHPLYQGMTASVELARKTMADYRSAMAEAVKNKRTLTTPEYERFAAMFQGFRTYLERRNYLVWQTSPWENGSPDAIAPLVYEENPVLQYAQAGNEREAVCLVLSGALCGDRMDVRFFVEPTNGASFVSGDQFRIYHERFIDHLGTRISAPLIQAPGNIVTLTPGSSERIWVVFDSAGVKPGDYSTVLKIKPLNDPSIPVRSIPIQAKVFNFALPETRDWPLDCFLWANSLTPIDEMGMLAMTHDYHIKYCMAESRNLLNGFSKDRTVVNAPPKGSKYRRELTETADEQFFREAKRLGMRLVFAWGTGPDVEWHKIVSDRLFKLGFGYDDFIFHGALQDEFKASDIPRQAKLREELRKADPKWQFMATYLSTPPPTGASLEQIAAGGLPEFFRYWAIIAQKAFAPGIGAQTAAALRGKDGQNKIWAYRCYYSMQGQDVFEYYRFFAWEAFLNKFDGIAMWTFAGAKNDGFDHTDGYDDGITLRGIDKRPVPTKRLEALREGLEDAAYMDLLQKRLTRYKAANPGKDCAGYEALLDQRLRAIMRDRNPREIEKWRLEVAEAIERLGR